MKKLEIEINELLGGYKLILGKLKARHELMKETRIKYREFLGNPERRKGDIKKHSGRKCLGYIHVV